MRLLFLLTAAVMLMASLIACAPLDVLNATVSENDYRAVTDIAYGSGPRQKLDIYIPTAKHANGDVVLFFYGGRWQSGEKSEYRFIAEAFTSRGYITVIPDYRLYPAVHFPAFIEDGALAYRWVEQHISAYQGSAKRIFVAGHSAGAYIAAMLALDEHYLQQSGATGKPCGTIGFAGPYDFLPLDADDLIAIFQTPQHITVTQPISFVDGSENPFLLLMGNDDTTVKERNAVNLNRRILNRGGKSTLIRYDGVDHIDMLLALSSTFRSKAPALDDADRFIQKTTCH